MDVGSALLERARAAGRNAIAVVGTGKNMGKTVTVAAICDALARNCGAVPFGLCSIGRDGEANDALEGFAKPRLALREGTLFATARALLPPHPAVEVVETLDERSAVGRLVIARVRAPGLFEIAGPPSAAAMRRVVARLRAAGAPFVVIDGAIDRVAALRDGEEGVVVATGAAAGTSLARVVDEMARLRVVAADAGRRSRARLRRRRGCADRRRRIGLRSRERTPADRRARSDAARPGQRIPCSGPAPRPALRAPVVSGRVHGRATRARPFVRAARVPRRGGGGYRTSLLRRLRMRRAGAPNAARERAALDAGGGSGDRRIVARTRDRAGRRLRPPPARARAALPARRRARSARGDRARGRRRSVDACVDSGGPCSDRCGPRPRRRVRAGRFRRGAHRCRTVRALSLPRRDRRNRRGARSGSLSRGILPAG